MRLNRTLCIGSVLLALAAPSSASAGTILNPFIKKTEPAQKGDSLTIDEVNRLTREIKNSKDDNAAFKLWNDLSKSMKAMVETKAGTFSRKDVKVLISSAATGAKLDPSAWPGEVVCNLKKKQLGDYTAAIQSQKNSSGEVDGKTLDSLVQQALQPNKPNG